MIHGLYTQQRYNEMVGPTHHLTLHIMVKILAYMNLEPLGVISTQSYNLLRFVL